MSNKKENTAYESLLELIQLKGTLKQDVYNNTFNVFEGFIKQIKKIVGEIKQSLPNLDSSIPVEYKVKNKYEVQVTIAGDVLLFHMHTNIFQFDRSHGMWKTTYLHQDENRSYCGIIYVYNFLKDSLKYERNGDMGYLIGRVFINKDNHYFVEGKRQIGFLYNNFSKSVINDVEIRKILESLLLYTLDFDLFIPQYDNVQKISVQEIKQINRYAPVQTGKRLGYQFKTEATDII